MEKISKDSLCYAITEKQKEGTGVQTFKKETKGDLTSLQKYPFYMEASGIQSPNFFDQNNKPTQFIF